MGIVGLAALVLFAGKVFVAARTTFKNSTNGQQPLPATYDGVLVSLRLPLVLIAVGTLIAFLFISSTIAIMGVFFIVLILWMLVAKLDENSDLVSEANLNLQMVNEKILSSARGGAYAGGTDTGRQYLPLLVGALLLVIAGLAVYYTLQDLRSNLVFAQSIQNLANNTPVREIYDAQRQAISLNPRRDAYRRAYANTNISVAQLVAAEKGETLTDTERQDVITLIQQSIREVRVITEVLYPTNALNWQMRGRIYQSLLGVARGADSWALHAFQQAIILAPQDPQLRVDLGGLFLRLAIEAPIPEGEQGDPPTQDIPQAPDTRATNLLRAEAAFQDAIRLKPDFANGHFNLAALYREAGRYDLAIRELETTLTLVPTDSPDYQQATQLLEQVRQQQSAQGGTPENTDTTQPEVTPTPEPEATPTVSPTPTVALPTPTPTVALENPQ
jgi:tetratricopeptide (TPR) repeat protein